MPKVIANVGTVTFVDNPWKVFSFNHCPVRPSCIGFYMHMCLEIRYHEEGMSLHNKFWSCLENTRPVKALFTLNVCACVCVKIQEWVLWQQTMVFILDICIWWQKSKKNVNADVSLNKTLNWAKAKKNSLILAAACEQQIGFLKNLSGSDVASEFAFALVQCERAFKKDGEKRSGEIPSL